MSNTYGPILVYYNYHSVPITREKMDNLLKFVDDKLSTAFDKFYFCCDVRTTPRDLTDYLETLDNVELTHFSLSSLTGQIVEAMCARMKWHASTIDGAPGLIVLVSTAGDFGSTLTLLARSGWRSAIFHPPASPTTFLDYADERFELPVTRSDEGNESAALMQALGHSVLQPPMNGTSGDKQSINADQITAIAQDVRQG